MGLIPDELVPYAIALAVVGLTISFFIVRFSTMLPPGEVFLNKERQSVPLEQIEQLSPDTFKFTFKLPRNNSIFGLPVGKHIKVFCPNPEPSEPGKWNKKEDKESGKEEIERKYTPVSSNLMLGKFELVIKVYRRGQPEAFPDGGKMSQYFESLKGGDTIDIQGPFGLYEYKGAGVFNMRRQDRKFKNVGILAGGTGITPMLQVVMEIMRKFEDSTKVWMIFANKTEDDILVREVLELIAMQHPNRFRLHFTLDHPPPRWIYSKGFISEDMIREHLPPPSDETVVLMCGPPPMIEFACKPNLAKVGHSKENIIEF